MLVQMIHVFQHGKLARHDNVVDCAEVLSVFGEADATGVRDDRDVESAKLGVS